MHRKQENRFAGYRIAGKKNFEEFYKFPHGYIPVQVSVRQTADDTGKVIIGASVRLEGKRHLLVDVLEGKGFGRLSLPGPGMTVEIPPFIPYRIERGKFLKIRCVIKEDGTSRQD